MYTSEQENYDYDKLNRNALEYDFLKIFTRRKTLTKYEFEVLGINPCKVFSNLIKVDNLSNKQLMLFIESDDEARKIKKKHKRVNIQSKPKSKKKKVNPITYTSKYRKYLTSDQWKMMRAGLFYMRGEKCEKCGSEENLQIHHNTYANIFKEKLSDLEILCRSCHRKEHES